MKCTVIIDTTREEEIIIYARKRNEIVEQIEEIAIGNTKMVTAYLKGEIVKLDVKDIYLFTIDYGKLYAVCKNEKYLIKSRLYNIEKILDTKFIKINQSSIARIDKIERFDATVGGTLKVIFKNGYIDYVSRRNIKNVKERLGL